MRRLVSALAVAVALLACSAPPEGGPERGTRPAATGAASGRPASVVLGPTTSETTAQQVTWRTAKPHTRQRLEVTARDGGPTLTFPARRKPATTVTSSGSAMPAWTARAEGLKPGTTYSYVIRNSAGSSTPMAFTTAREDIGTWRFLALGDTQIDNAKVPAATLRAGLSRFPDSEVVLLAGDVVNHPWVKREWTDLMTALTPARVRRDILVSIGNHEQCVLVKRCRSGSAQGFRGYFSFPDNGYPKQRPTWFSVDRQGVRFVVLDAFGSDLARQAAFLDRELSTNPQRWSVVLLHSGPMASRADRTNDAVFGRIRPLLQKHDVDLVLSGHDHSYARGHLGDADSTVYATSVSGPKFYTVSSADWRRRGATRVRWAERTATYQVIDVSEGELRYRAVVTHRGKGARPAASVGSTLDDVRLTKDAEGRRTVTW